MRPLHRRLADEIAKRTKTWAPAPEGAARLAAAAKRFPGGIPDDYRAFLLELGSVPWPMEISSVADYPEKEWPPGFAPFARDATLAYGFLARARQPVSGDLASDLRLQAATLRELVAEQIAEGAPEEEVEDERAEADALDREATDLDAKAAARKARDVARPDEVRIESVGLAARQLRSFADGEDERESFAEWLERRIRWAIEREARDAESDRLAAVEAAENPAAEPETPDELALRRALDLIDRLVASGALETTPAFDDAACAKLLVEAWGDAADLIDALVDAPGIEEVFISEDAMDTLVATVSAND